MKIVYNVFAIGKMLGWGDSYQKFRFCGACNGIKKSHYLCTSCRAWKLYKSGRTAWIFSVYDLLQIKQLENELNCLLFERINHTITLTQRGQELVSYAHQVRALTEDFKERLTKEQDCQGHIHIVMPDSVCEEMLNSCYLDFHNKYPNISIRFTMADTSVMFDMLDHNAADAIITLDSHSYHKDYVIAKEEPLSMHFVTSAGSRYANQKNLRIADIMNEPFILTECGRAIAAFWTQSLPRNLWKFRRFLKSEGPISLRIFSQKAI